MGRKEAVIKKEGVIKETLRNGLFRVEIDEKEEVLAHLSGKLRRYHIKVLSGDKVVMEFSPYDLTKGRIVYRL